MKKGLFIFCLLLSISCQSWSKEIVDSTGTAEDDSVALEKKWRQIDSTISSMEYDSGQVVLEKNLATIKVPRGFGYLKAADAQFILEKVWNNPIDVDVLGMLLPLNTDFYSSDSWAIIYTYAEDGHVNDDDAADIKYDELLEQMQKDVLEGNAERKEDGYPPMELIGWAKSPFYDKTNHKLHWAKELKFGDDSSHTLNYNIRMLGRKGVLVMNVIAGIEQLKLVEQNMPVILASTNFINGQRYEDFDEGLDKVAEYGIGGLIAGGILLKTGLLAKIGIFLLKGWKLITLGVVSLFAFLRKKFMK